MREAFLKRWWQFTWERFEPLSHALMIGLFVTVHAALVGEVLSNSIPWDRLAFTLLFATLFFFKLRLYDEIKDYETDLEFNPTRPLARGLISLKEIKRAIAVIIALELLILFVLGPISLAIGSLAITYSLLMYCEFFVGSWLRPRLTTYAVSHTIVCSLLSCTLIQGLSQTENGFSFWPYQIWAFVIANWFLFNVFEFGRKTFATSEERERVPSYSKIFGKTGAVALVFTQAALATALYAFAFESELSRIALVVSLCVLLVSGGMYVRNNSARTALAYRKISSIYIVLAFISVLFTGVLR